MSLTPGQQALAQLKVYPASAFHATVATGADAPALPAGAVSDVSWSSSPLKFLTTLGVGIAVGFAIERFGHRCPER